MLGLVIVKWGQRENKKNSRRNAMESVKARQHSGDREVGFGIWALTSASCVAFTFVLSTGLTFLLLICKVGPVLDTHKGIR